MRIAVAALCVLLFSALQLPLASAHVSGDATTEKRHIARRARDRLGNNYCWGGTRGCYDCSGFSHRVFAEHGADLPHSSRDQFRTRSRPGYLTVWRRGNLKKGDLVFFKNTYKPGISHVGVYSGEGRFIHASSNGVKRDSLHESYYRRHFAAGVRPKALRP